MPPKKKSEMTDTKEERPSVAAAEPKSEIRFAPDARLNLAYNPNYTYEAEARESFIRVVPFGHWAFPRDLKRPVSTTLAH